MESEEPEIKSKQASKRDRTLHNFKNRMIRLADKLKHFFLHKNMNKHIIFKIIERYLKMVCF